MTENNGHQPAAQQSGKPARGSGKAVGRVVPTTNVNVAFPLSQIKIQEPSEHLIALTALVQELATLLAEIAPGPAAERLVRRAETLVDRHS